MYFLPEIFILISFSTSAKWIHKSLLKRNNNFQREKQGSHENDFIVPKNIFFKHKISKILIEFAHG